ncbi:WD repeat- and FYVE domain-containing protein 4 isoform X2 [Sardina pilchardus]|uniref:WD repeat- and FYVE domain-containing protein 4 isoform X2 n=1 Tax=Sardina pilchardus TaxID=27697 RepID=UPI002E14AFDA
MERINKETGELSASGEVETREAAPSGHHGDAGVNTSADADAELVQTVREGLSQLQQRAQLPAEQWEHQLLGLLPLYIQVSESSSGLDDVDLRTLASQVCATLVHHIQDRLNQRPAEEARRELAQFFQKTESSAGGWLLLKALSLLSARQTAVTAAVKCGLPAALVRCLYVFVAVPSNQQQGADQPGQPDADADADTDADADADFRQLLIQVILQHCRQLIFVEELVEAQELQCVIISMTTLWDQCSSSWRRQASRVLRAVSAAQARNTVPVLQAKNCMRLCIQNLKRISGAVPGVESCMIPGSGLVEVASEAGPKIVPGSVLAEVAVSVFCFIRDSYQLSPVLFEEFESNDGYGVLQAILERCEEEVCVERFQPVEDLLGLISSLTLFGRSELKVALCVTNPQPPGFKFIPSLTKGSAVKNLRAFGLLQSCFLRSTSVLLCVQVLRTVQTVWSWDRANFFLLEWTLGSLAQMAAVAWRKPAPVHPLFCELLETVVLQLDYIPHEALQQLQAVFKQSPGEAFNGAVLASFQKMALRCGLLAEVLSEAGMLDLLLLELRRHAKVLRKQGMTGNEQHVEESDRRLTTSMLKLVAALAMRSIRNTVCIRDRGMVPYVKVFLDDEEFRAPALNILEQLAEVNPEEYMSSVIGALCSSTHTEHTLKLHLLQSVLKVLESPSSWPAFRVSGGFEGLLSLVSELAGALTDPVGAAWASLGRHGVSELVLLALHTMATAVHLDPVNGHLLESEGYYVRLAHALLALGCFQEPPAHTHTHTHTTHTSECAHWRSFRQLVVLTETPSPPLPPTLLDCVRLLGYLEQFATGVSLEPPEVVAEGQRSTGQRSTQQPAEEEEPQGRVRGVALSVSSVTSDINSRFTCDQTILHPAAIRLIIILLPRVYHHSDPQLSLEVQYAVADHVQLLLRSERNRQIMCEGGLLSVLLTSCPHMLLTPAQPLHLPAIRILEKLASQSISPTNLRRYLCLGNPFLCSENNVFPQPAAVANDEPCSEENGVKKNVRKLKKSFSLLSSSPQSGSALPLHQIISLVSMTSPRSFRPQKLSATPSFVEFDMSESGYGCLFLPSLATVKGVSSDGISTGGVGKDCRGFPPAAGLTFSCWFLVSRFSAACDSHPLRLLTVVRHMSRAPQSYVCLAASIAAADGSLIISTDEEPYQDLDIMEPEVGTPLPSTVRFKCSQQLSPAQWHQLTLVLAKDIKRSCKVTAYLNAKVIGSAKYIKPFPGQCASMDPTAVIDVCGIIGTPSLWKQHAALVWRVGPSFLFEEPLGPDAVETVYSQGTCYLGNYLALTPQDGSSSEGQALGRLVPEERISFGINPAVFSLTTVAQIRDDYNEVDCRLIAKEMGIASRDNTTPVLLCRNISQHLAGTSRAIGAALVGRFGVRTFLPNSAARSFQYIGGPAVILSLIAMATDDSSLYAAVKVCVSVLSTNTCMEQDMRRMQGYKLLAFLLKMKAPLISSRTFQLVLSLTGTVELGSGSGLVYNLPAFQQLLCDAEMWQKAPENLDLSVLNHFTDILKASSESAELMHRLDMVDKLLFQLHEPACSVRKVQLVTSVLSLQLQGHLNHRDVSRIGLFVVSTLLPPTIDENVLLSAVEFNEQGLTHSPVRMLWVRNQLLELIISLLSPDTVLTQQGQLQVYEALGVDWFFMLLQSHLHKSSVLLGVQLLSLLLTHTHTHTHAQLISSLRDTHTPGTLLKHTVEPSASIDNLRVQVWSKGGVSTTYGGFEVLQKLLESQVHLPNVYATLAALLLNTQPPHTPAGQVDLDSILQGLLDSSTNTSHTSPPTTDTPQTGHTPQTAHTPQTQLCVEAACILVELVRVIITQRPVAGSDAWPETGSDVWQVQYPGSVMQFLCLVHSVRPRDPLWTRPDFLSALARALFPPSTEGNAEAPPPHPARKQVCDFSRILLLDSLMHIPASDTHTHHPLEQLLEFSPEGVCEDQKQVFQTELLLSLIELIHITGQEDTHLSRDDSPSGGSSQAVLLENVVVFCAALVEKLYTGLLNTDAETLLVFIAEQVVLAMEKSQINRERTVSALYKSLNRSLLYFLCGPRITSCEQQRVVRTLRTMEQQWDVVMATYNNNVHFTSCLLHCLLLVRSGSYPEGFGCEGFRRPLPLPDQSTEATPPCQETHPSEVESELMCVVESVWVRVLQERRSILEEAFKLDLSAKGGRDQPVAMGDVSPLWEETAQKAWTTFIDAQKKRLESAPSRRSMITAAVRAVYRRNDKEASGSVEDFLNGMEAFRKTAQEMFDCLLSNHTQAQQCQGERVEAMWEQQEAELLRERGVFGPAAGVWLQQRWVQDATEGPGRTRARVRRRALRRSRKMQVLTSSVCVKSNPVEESRGVTENWDTDPELRILCEAGREAEEAGLDCDQLTFFPELSEPLTSNTDTHACTETHIILQELRDQEEVKAKMSVVQVNGYQVCECVLLFGKADLYLCEGFNLTPSGDVCCTNHQPSSIRDSYLSSMFKKEKVSTVQSCKRWPYDDIKDAHFMRYLLEDNALEIFLRNGSSVFLVFPNKEHISAYKRLSSVTPALKGKGMEAVFNMRRSGGVEKSVLLRWQKGEMSNFEYLMHLNTLAGRTYNDLMQYPIFPWVLADYHSQTLDLSEAATFRDLSKPMGAQTERRRDNFIQRYNEVDTTEGDLAVQCHYCTHYSSAIIVASFLVRMEPFSHTFLTLQGGSFDVPERMFHRVQSEWESASRDNMSDVRELIPEFYYLPDFLINTNNLQFGCMQDGTSLGDVVLPPWAKGDPQEFIRIHREALECEYVSAHLHLWVDLIFGVRQHGPAALESLNCFHPYFYPHHLDPALLSDPLQRSTVLGYINNFGQVPKQLFTKPHPSRFAQKKDTPPSSTIMPFYLQLDKIKPSATPIKELQQGPVGQVVCMDRDVLVLEGNRLFVPPLGHVFFSWGSYDNSCAFGNYATDKTFAMCESVCNWGETLCAVCPNATTIITGGTSSVVCVWDVLLNKDKLTHMRLKQPLYGHTDAVTCVVASEAHGLIVSGSRDHTCILWDLEELSYITQLAGHAQSVCALAINTHTGEIVSCAGTHLYLWSVRGQLLSSLETGAGPEGRSLCCLFTQRNEWDPHHAIVTGGNDGIIRIWRTEYSCTQLPTIPQGSTDHHEPQGGLQDDAGVCVCPGSVSWERHLVLCSELNRSQVVSRRRYRTNPAVTALAVSRTNGTLLVGDAWGRVFSWTCEV